MQYFRLFDMMSPPDGDLYKVDTDTGEAWLLDERGQDPIAAFVLSAHMNGRTPSEELHEYARRYGSIVEVSAP